MLCSIPTRHLPDPEELASMTPAPTQKTEAPAENTPILRRFDAFISVPFHSARPEFPVSAEHDYPGPSVERPDHGPGDWLDKRCPQPNDTESRGDRAHARSLFHGLLWLELLEQLASALDPLRLVVACDG